MHDNFSFLMNLHTFFHSLKVKNFLYENSTTKLLNFCTRNYFFGDYERLNGSFLKRENFMELSNTKGLEML